MRFFTQLIDNAPPFLRVILFIPWTLFSILVIPFQLVYFLSSGRKRLENDFNPSLDDQTFKNAISLIELHKVRFGKYPESLQEEQFKKFLGNWDNFIYSSVTYLKTESGYELNLNSQESSRLEYPPEFWRGLGLVKTNVRGFLQD